MLTQSGGVAFEFTNVLVLHVAAFSVKVSNSEMRGPAEFYL